MTSSGEWQAPEGWTSPTVTRARIALEVAAELISKPNERINMAMVQLRDEADPPGTWRMGLVGSNSHEGLDAVVNGNTIMAMMNPSGQLGLACKGVFPYDKPQPVRSIAVIPSYDQFVFGVDSKTGLRTFEEIATKRYPLKISVRGQIDHSLHFMLHHIMEAAGFSADDLRSWGGALIKEGGLPFPGGPKFKAMARGEINAIFDEAAEVWVNGAVEAGMTLLPLSEATVRKVEAKGLRRGMLEKRHYKNLVQDILTVDFSGWPIFVHADAPDELVTRICAALDARKDHIPWQSSGPLPVNRMCQDLPENPMNAPLHPAAERFWKKRGYLK